MVERVYNAAPGLLGRHHVSRAGREIPKQRGTLQSQLRDGSFRVSLFIPNGKVWIMRQRAAQKAAPEGGRLAAPFDGTLAALGEI